MFQLTVVIKHAFLKLRSAVRMGAKGSRERTPVIPLTKDEATGGGLKKSSSDGALNKNGKSKNKSYQYTRSSSSISDDDIEEFRYLRNASKDSEAFDQDKFVVTLSQTTRRRLKMLAKQQKTISNTLKEIERRKKKRSDDLITKDPFENIKYKRDNRKLSKEMVTNYASHFKYKPLVYGSGGSLENTDNSKMNLRRKSSIEDITKKFKHGFRRRSSLEIVKPKDSKPLNKGIGRRRSGFDFKRNHIRRRSNEDRLKEVKPKYQQLPLVTVKDEASHKPNAGRAPHKSSSRPIEDIVSWPKNYHHNNKLQQPRSRPISKEDGDIKVSPVKRRHTRRNSLDEDAIRKAWGTPTGRNKEPLPNVFSSDSSAPHKRYNQHLVTVSGKSWDGRKKSPNQGLMRSSVSLPSLNRSNDGTPRKPHNTRGNYGKPPSTQSSSILSKYIEPFEKPGSALQAAYQNLASGDWEQEMNGIMTFLRLCEHHPHVLYPELHQVIKCLIEQIKNLRSQVCKAAIEATGQLFLSLKKSSLDQELDKLVALLLQKSADTNKFIREDCNVALDNMLLHTTPVKAVAALQAGGLTHKNLAVRANVARLLAELEEQLGADKILSGQVGLTDKLLQAGTQLLQDSSIETRTHAKRLFSSLVKHPNFQRQLSKHVQKNVVKDLEKMLESLKNEDASRKGTRTTRSRYPMK